MSRFFQTRAYATQSTGKKGGKVLKLAALAGLGAAGGIYYNQKQATVAPVAVAAAPSPSAFDPSQFKGFKVRIDIYK